MFIINFVAFSVFFVKKVSYAVLSYEIKGYLLTYLLTYLYLSWDSAITHFTYTG